MHQATEGKCLSQTLTSCPHSLRNEKRRVPCNHTTSWSLDSSCSRNRVIGAFPLAYSDDLIHTGAGTKALTRLDNRHTPLQNPDDALQASLFTYADAYLLMPGDVRCPQTPGLASLEERGRFLHGRFSY